MSDNVFTLIEQNIGYLEAAIQGAKDKWSGYAVAAEDLFDGGQSTQVLGAINNTMVPAIQTWEARGRVLETNPAPAQSDLDTWVSQGQGYIKDFQDVAGYSADANLVDIVVDTATATGNEVAADAKAAAGAVGGALTWWGTNGKTVMWSVAILAVLWFAWPLLRKLA